MSGAPEPVLEVARLCKTYGATRAVDDVSFRVERNEIVGPLGADAQAMLNRPDLLRLDEPTAGTSRAGTGTRSGPGFWRGTARNASAEPGRRERKIAVGRVTR